MEVRSGSERKYKWQIVLNLLTPNGQGSIHNYVETGMLCMVNVKSVAADVKQH